jgi:hypothetical protein
MHSLRFIRYWTIESFTTDCTMDRGDQTFHKTGRGETSGHLLFAYLLFVVAIVMDAFTGTASQSFRPAYCCFSSLIRNEDGHGCCHLLMTREASSFSLFSSVARFLKSGTRPDLRWGRIFVFVALITGCGVPARIVWTRFCNLAGC